ncbi:hypothetical protein GOODEAATRI_018141, partial [Goodea atripinnis]
LADFGSLAYNPAITSGSLTQTINSGDAEEPGPLSYKGSNQWSFGKTDGKPLADH